ncbi:hypothetical protein BDV06DRAFT_217525 [Aspergillus oleicola]
MNTSYCGDPLMEVSISIAVVQIVVVAARFHTRHLQRLKCTWDDYLMIPAPIMSLGQSALYIVLLSFAGIGYRLEHVEQTPEKLVALQKGLVANQIMDTPFIVTPAKISILLFYLRIFGTSRFRIMFSVVGSLVLAIGIGVFFAAIFQSFYRYVSLPQILTDLITLIMPLSFVWKLQKRLTQKIALTGGFLLGGLGIVTSILRMAIFFQGSALRGPTWTSVNLGIWTLLEGAIIIAACLPPI